MANYVLLARPNSAFSNTSENLGRRKAALHRYNQGQNLPVASSALVMMMHRPKGQPVLQISNERLPANFDLGETEMQ